MVKKGKSMERKGIVDGSRNTKKSKVRKGEKGKSSFIIAIFIVVIVLFATVFNILYINKSAASDKSGELQIIDSSGNIVTLEKAPKRIIIDGKQQELFALGAADKIVGWNCIWKDYRTDIWNKFQNESGVDISVITDQKEIGDSTKKTLNIEEVVELEPDLYVFIMEPGYLAYKDQLEKFGITSVYLDFFTESNIPSSIVSLGKILGEEEKGIELANFYKEQVKKVTDILATIKSEKPTVYIENGLGGSKIATYGTYGPTHMFGGLVTMAGGTDIAQSAGLVQYGTVTPEFVLDADPDVIIFTGATTTPQGYNVKLGYYATEDGAQEALVKKIDRPGWSNLTAVKNGRVYAINHDMSRTIMDFYTIQMLAKWLYPQNFTPLDPDANMREFHTRFLGMTYTGTWAVEIND